MLAVDEAEQLPVAAAREGNAAAWDALFRRYQLTALRVCVRIIAQRTNRARRVQETFINATRYLRSLREDGKFGLVALQHCAPKMPAALA